MDYVVEPLLYDLRNPIVRGLSDGSLTRWGGVIRRSAGQPGAGQIAAHLRDLIPTTAVPDVLGGVLQLGQVAAAASVLNLGVSVVGFAIMAKKLNRLQGDLQTLQRTVGQNHGEVMSSLADVQSRLVELRYIGMQSQDLIIEAVAQIRLTRQDILHGYLARMMTEYDALCGTAVSPATLGGAVRTFREARHWLEMGIEAELPTADSVAHWFDVLMRFRAWCCAVVGEVSCLRRQEARSDAALLANETAGKARAWGGRWVAALAPANEMGGVHRFTHSAFRALPDETRLRLARLQAGGFEASLRPITEHLDAARAVAEHLPALPPSWVETQRALASVLDFVEEATERLDAMALDVARCNVHRLSFSEWEGLPAPTSETALGVIVLGVAA